MSKKSGRAAKGTGIRNLEIDADTGVYRARFEINGRAVRRSLRTRDRKKAVERLKVLREQVGDIRAGDEPPPLYRDHVKAWIAGGLGGVKDGTADRYKVSLRRLSPSFENKLLTEIDRRSIGAYVEKCQARGDSNATIKRDLTALSRCLSNAVAMGKIDHNAAREWDRSTIKTRRHVITRPDPRSIAMAIAVAPFPFNHLIEFLLANGSRLEETADLRVEHVDLAAAQASFMKTKSSRPRRLNLSAEAVAILRAIRRPNHETDFVFWNPDVGTSWASSKAPRGPRLKNLSRRFQDVKQAAAARAREEGWTFRPFRLHDLRHEYAIRWIERHGSIYTLQKHLGHSSVTVTEQYLDYVTPEAAAAARGDPSPKPSPLDK